MPKYSNTADFSLAIICDLQIITNLWNFVSADSLFLLQSLSVLYFTENGGTSNLAIVNGASNKNFVKKSFLTDSHDENLSKEETSERKKAV